MAEHCRSENVLINYRCPRKVATWKQKYLISGGISKKKQVYLHSFRLSLQQCRTSAGKNGTGCTPVWSVHRLMSTRGHGNATKLLCVRLLVPRVVFCRRCIVTLGTGLREGSIYPEFLSECCQLSKKRRIASELSRHAKPVECPAGTNQT